MSHLEILQNVRKCMRMVCFQWRCYNNNNKHGCSFWSVCSMTHRWSGFHRKSRTQIKASLTYFQARTFSCLSTECPQQGLSSPRCLGLTGVIDNVYYPRKIVFTSIAFSLLQPRTVVGESVTLTSIIFTRYTGN